jgi:hypothetical protein
VNGVSTADANFAETQENSATVLRTPKTQLRAETREQHDLIDLALHGTVSRASEDFVGNNLPFRVERGL